MVVTMETADTNDIDNWQHIGSIARRLARRLVEQRLAAARQGPAPIPAANDNADRGEIQQVTAAARNPCSVSTSP